MGRNSSRLHHRGHRDLVGDARPLARGVACGPGKVRFDADVERVKRISVRAELPLP